eukprot:755299-Hanusia_phi.AAC.5
MDCDLSGMSMKCRFGLSLVVRKRFAPSQMRRRFQRNAMLQELVCTSAVRVARTLSSFPGDSVSQEVQRDLRGWKPVRLQDSSGRVDQRAQNERTQRHVDLLRSIAFFRVSASMTGAAGSRRHADGCQLLRHAPADGSSLR